MDENKECRMYIQPVRDVLEILNGKWKLPIIIALGFGSRKFNELERDIAGITPRMLSKELRDLEANKLISRTVHKTNPITVSYSITDYGRSLDTVIASIRTWGLKHREKVFTENEQADF